MISLCLALPCNTPTLGFVVSAHTDFINSTYHICGFCGSTITDCSPSVPLHNLLALLYPVNKCSGPPQDHHRAIIIWVVDHS